MIPVPVEQAPAGLVWQTQQPLVISNLGAETRWQEVRGILRGDGMNSICDLPLTTARRRLGALAFVSKQVAAYDTADLDFLQHVAN